MDETAIVRTSGARKGYPIWGTRVLAAVGGEASKLSYVIRCGGPHTGPVQINLVDLLLVAVLLVGAATGWARGFLFSAIDMLALAASLASAFLG